MNAAPYSWLEVGSGLKTTNLATFTSNGTSTLIPAPNSNIIIYQIDWDLGTGDVVVVGDNQAVEGTDRIVFKSSSAGSGSRTFPNGWYARAAEPIVALMNNTSGNVAAWFRITYALSTT